jgi:hypothetical protein
VYEADNREIQLDSKLNQKAQYSKHSVYGSDFVDWEKREHLIVKRPEERYYHMRFRGQSHF